MTNQIQQQGIKSNSYATKTKRREKGVNNKVT